MNSTTETPRSSIRCDHVAIMPGRGVLSRRPPGSEPAAGKAEAPGQLSPGVQKFVRYLSTPAVSRVGGVALIRLDGPLMSDVGWLYDSVECITHSAMAQVCRDLASDLSIHTVALDLSCPGWGVEGSSDTIAGLNAIVAAGKRLVAYVHDLAASGGVWMACMCSEISISPSGWMGSIGSMILAYDTSKAFADEGIKAVVIASDPSKACGYPGVEISEEYVSNRQRIVDLHTKDFFAVVSKARGIDVGQIAEMHAGMFAAADTVTKRLADRVETPDAWMLRMAGLQPPPPPPSPTDTPGTGQSPGGDPAPVPPPPTPAPTARKTKESRMDFSTLTLSDLRAGAATLVSQIEKEATDRAVAAEQAKLASPATYAQLKEAFAGDAAFIVDCQDKGSTMAQAHQAYAAKLRTDLATASARIVDLEAKVAAGKSEAPTGPRISGADPLDASSNKAKDPGAGADHPFLASVKAHQASTKCSLSDAMIQMARKDPAGHKAYVASCQKQA